MLHWQEMGFRKFSLPWKVNVQSHRNQSVGLQYKSRRNFGPSFGMTYKMG